jgi:hypothetical protein
MNSSGRTRLSERSSYDRARKSDSHLRNDSETASGTKSSVNDPAAHGAGNDSWSQGTTSHREPTAVGTGDGDTSPVKPDANTHPRDPDAQGSNDRNHDGIPDDSDSDSPR